ncbi:ribonuclease H-like domain-containing protein [Patescibacteria group bacterium]|nr:ribonuclease H-like domain-containing protein [Patescibacteria group bacterium]MBU4458531.1 ribonuclease H-like domain-containing protein [Patescibacteria group bacterium]
MGEKIFLDIETIPAHKEHHEVLRFINVKKEAQKKKFEDFESMLLKTSFDGAFGRILCIGYAINDNPIDILYEKDDEKKILEDFWELAKNADLFIGHNVMDFDLRFIYQRSIVNNVKPTKDLSFARYRNNPIFDTMREWSKWNISNENAGLEYIALAMGISSPKNNIDGSQVYDYYKKGKIKEILEYCKKDVETTRLVYKRMIFENDCH